MIKSTNHAAAHFSTLMLLSPAVMTSRMTEFWTTASAPTDLSRREVARMVTEKVQAAGESVIAVNVALAKMTMETLAAAMTGTFRASGNDADDIWTAALRPYAARVTANGERLLG